MGVEMLCLARLEGIVYRVELTNPPVCADPEMRVHCCHPRGKRGFLTGQKHPVTPQLDRSCIELESKIEMHQ